MNKIVRIVCVLTMVVLLFSTMGVGAFAEVDDVNTDASETTQKTDEGISSSGMETEDVQSTEQGETTDEVVLAGTETPDADIVLKAVAGNGSVSLSWDAVEGETYNVFKGDEETPINSGAVSGSSYVDESLVNGETYTYQVKSIADEGEDVSVSNIISVTPIEPISTLKGFSGYFSIHLEWPKVEGAKEYIIKRTSGNTTKTYRVKASDADIQTYKDKDDKRTDGGKGLNWDKKYQYNVTPVFEEDMVVGTVSNTTNGKTCVKPMYYKITFNQTKTLTSHDGTKTKKTFKKGQTVYSHRFSAGLYHFYYNGHLFRANKSRSYKTGSKKRVCVYSGKENYSTKEAEYFVNDFAGKNKKNWLIWASTQCQHVYAFNWDSKQGKWVSSNYKGMSWNWECATGKANSPSPCGINYSLYKKVSKRHSLPYWSSFSGWNSFHGKLKSWVMGKPASGGCVRNDVANAKKIYTYVPKYSRVICY